MSIGFAFDHGNADGSIGGAELTMREFAAASPVALIDWLEADTVVVGNCVSFDGPETVEKLRGKRVIRYWHDLARHEHPELRAWLTANATHIFTSPLHLRLHEIDGVWPIIPPAVDLSAFRPPRQTRRNGHRSGTCSVGAWMNPGKGGHLVSEWAARHEPVDAIGPGPFAPPGQKHLGPVDPSALPQLLWGYERMVFLPSAPEPFGRSVVEAWAAGCQLVINENVGAKYFIENDPEALETAAERFWEVVVG